ncbi:MAG: porphobilinogen synthase [Planctomycetaceae bacterium]|jgi:porphobilinogen synthase|nr:porphobilinogen synthase [Planctomycetaceae bacterium]
MPQNDTPQPGTFPVVRMRRLRYNKLVRELVQETSIPPDKLIYPLFLRSGQGIRVPIGSMPGVFQLSLDEMVREIEELKSLGIGGVLLFGIPDTKDACGSDALNSQGIIAQAVRAAKDAAQEKLLVITDLCFCEYTDHGHCGILTEIAGHADVDNDATLKMIADQALVHAEAGADMIAPSGMIDGMIGAVRGILDRNRFEHLPVMSYAAKYASGFYGPFRDAAESAPQFGDRRSYQMDPAAAAEQALREVELDLAEGADIVMVKPAMVYLDIMRMVRERFPNVPLAAYNVSGEYSMVKAAAERGWIDESRIVRETLTAIRRAGANIIITYWAKDIAAGNV